VCWDANESLHSRSRCVVRLSCELLLSLHPTSARQSLSVRRKMRAKRSPAVRVQRTLQGCTRRVQRVTTCTVQYLRAVSHLSSGATAVHNGRRSEGPGHAHRMAARSDEYRRPAPRSDDAVHVRACPTKPKSVRGHAGTVSLFSSGCRSYHEPYSASAHAPPWEAYTTKPSLLRPATMVLLQ